MFHFLKIPIIIWSLGNCLFAYKNDEEVVKNCVKTKEKGERRGGVIFRRVNFWITPLINSNNDLARQQERWELFPWWRSSHIPQGFVSTHESRQSICGTNSMTTPPNDLFWSNGRRWGGVFQSLFHWQFNFKWFVNNLPKFIDWRQVKTGSGGQFKFTF